MKFNVDVAREILIVAESAEPNRVPEGLPLESLSPDEMIEYYELLDEAGLMEVKFARSSMGSGARIYRATPIRLTYEGHQFLSIARNQTFWERAKDHVVSKGGAVTIEVLKGLLTGYAKQAVGLLGDAQP